MPPHSQFPGLKKYRRGGRGLSSITTAMSAAASNPGIVDRDDEDTVTAPSTPVQDAAAPVNEVEQLVIADERPEEVGDDDDDAQRDQPPPQSKRTTKGQGTPKPKNMPLFPRRTCKETGWKSSKFTLVKKQYREFFEARRVPDEKSGQLSLEDTLINKLFGNVRRNADGEFKEDGEEAVPRCRSCRKNGCLVPDPENRPDGSEERMMVPCGCDLEGALLEYYYEMKGLHNYAASFVGKLSLNAKGKQPKVIQNAAGRHAALEAVFQWEILNYPLKFSIKNLLDLDQKRGAAIQKEALARVEEQRVLAPLWAKPAKNDDEDDDDSDAATTLKKRKKGGKSGARSPKKPKTTPKRKGGGAK